MKKLLFYSHDTFGLGNIRRTLSICNSLTANDPDLSILVVSGSPMVQSFRIPKGVDYVKLPCVTRSERDGYTSKFLGEHPEDLRRLRSDMILCATAHFKPDVILVDKNPLGVQRELETTLSYVKQHFTDTQLILLLRDILDSPEATRRVWSKAGYFQAIEKFYSQVLVLGWPRVFDPRKEYQFPTEVRKQVRFCGYIQREAGQKSREEVREELGLTPEDRLVLVTAGGGEDGSQVFKNYLQGLKTTPLPSFVKTLMIFGPEMPDEQKRALNALPSRDDAQVKTLEFTNDLMSYMQAADLVVSMGGYGTVCEILSADKRAIIIPRIHPVEEQGIRAERMARMGLITMIHPESLTPRRLLQSVRHELEVLSIGPASRQRLKLDALPRMTSLVHSLLEKVADTSGHQLPAMGVSGERGFSHSTLPYAPYAYLS